MASMWRRLGDLPVWWRITIPALGALVGLTLVALAAFGGLTILHDATRAEAHTRDALLRSANLEADFLNMVAALRGYRLDRDPAFLTSYAASQQQLDAQLADLRALVADNPPQVARVDRLRAMIDAWETETALATLQAAPDAPIPPAPAARAIELIAAARAQRAAFDNMELDLLASREATAERALQQTLLATGVALLLELLIVILTATVATRSITRPLGRLTEVADRWRRGDLNARVALRSGDELGRVGRAFNLMAERLATDRAALEAANRGYHLLHDLNVRLITDDESRAPLSGALAVLRDELGYDAVELWWRTDGHLALVADAPGTPTTVHTTRSCALGEGVVGHVAESSQELVIPEAQTAPAAAAAHHWLRTAGLNSVAALPLLSAAGARGTLLLASSSTMAPSADALAVLRTAAHRLALVIERREVHARLEASNRALARATQAKSEFLVHCSSKWV